MSAPPFMPFYVRDYVADTQHLTTAEHGAYLLLLMAMWSAGGRLPADDMRLARLAKCAPEAWAEMRATILAFFTRRGGHIRHKRITGELARYDDKIVRARRGGKVSASKNARENNGKFAAPLGIGLEPKAGQTEADTDTDTEEKKDTPPTPQLPLALPAPVDVGRQVSKAEAFAAFWAAYPLKVAKLAAEKAFTTAWTRTLNGAPQDRLALLVTGAETYRAETVRRALPPDKIAHAATWLNAGRWMDAPPPKPPIWDGVQ